MPNTPFDPQSLPVDAFAGEAPVPAERLTASWLRSHFANPPAGWVPEQFAEHLLDIPTRRPGLTEAAVLIALVQRQTGLHLLLTRRTAHLTDHPGQISFPGGRAEPEDRGPEDTALRETEEEIGLARAHIEILGTLPAYLTITGYRVAPVVALVAPPFDLHPDPNEVAEVFEVPLAYLMDGANHQRRSLQTAAGGAAETRRSFYAMPYERHFIWGATAGMLRNLFHFLRS